jgi:hypothetical protein
MLYIQAKGGMDNIVNDLVGQGSTITRNGKHQAVRVGNLVYDNYFPNGVPYDDYVNNLHAPLGLKFTSVAF